MTIPRPHSSLEELHPECRSRIVRLEEALADEDLPFRRFECFRTPGRQRYLYSKGRREPYKHLKIVTGADAWISLHQYGVAVDFVLAIQGVNPWAMGEHLPKWKRLHELGKQHGLEPLLKRVKGRLVVAERPHLQLPWSLSALRQGLYPPGGDETWTATMAEAIASFPMGAPPMPEIEEFEDRPALAYDWYDGPTEVVA
jgi:hypothetical protein